MFSSELILNASSTYHDLAQFSVRFFPPESTPDMDRTINGRIAARTSRSFANGAWCCLIEQMLINIKCAFIIFINTLLLGAKVKCQAEHVASLGRAVILLRCAY